MKYFLIAIIFSYSGTLSASVYELIWKNKNAGVYTVKLGDSLSQIATRQKVSMKRLLALNPKIQQNLIKPGQAIHTS